MSDPNIDRYREHMQPLEDTNKTLMTILDLIGEQLPDCQVIGDYPGGVKELKQEIAQRDALLREALPYIDTNPDLHRPGGDELKERIAALLRESEKT